MEWIEHHGDFTATWSADGFDFKASTSQDDDGLRFAKDYLGELAWEDEPRRVRFAALGLESELRRAASYQRWHGNDEWPTGYIPSNNYPEDTPENREYWKQDAKMLLEHLTLDRCILIVDVECSRAGVELGSASLCGIDVDSTWEGETEKYVTSTALELAEEALSDAKAKLAELQAVTI